MLDNFRTYQISKSFYSTCKTLRLPRHLKDQLSRSSSSVCLNVAEGAGRDTPADQRRFYTIAFASLRESQAVLDLELGPTHQANVLADKLAAHLYRLIHGR